MPQKYLLARKKKEKATQALQQGRTDEAARLLEQCCKTTPGDTDAWIRLASIHGQQGNFDAVADCCHRVLSITPGHPAANSLLGNTLALQGNNAAARACYRKSLSVNPNDVGTLNNLGTSLYLAGELGEADEILNRVVKLKPDYADAHNNLGNIYRALNKNSEAIHHFQRALALNPQLFETWLNLGNIYSDRVGHPQAAEDCFRKALQLKPDSVGTECALANMLRFQGKLEESLAVTRAIIGKRPDDRSTLAHEADILERMGRHDEAYAKVRSLLEHDQVNARAVGLLARLCRRYDCCDEAIRLGESFTAGDTLNNTDRQRLHFSLGKLHDKLGNFDNAFEHYRHGNEINDVPFDAGGYEEAFRAIIRTFNSEALENLPKACHGDSRPVFIIGMPRSGTSLTEQVLASHPEVYGAGELNDINDIAAGLTRALGSTKAYPDSVGDLNQFVVDQLANRYLNRLDSFSITATCITDKMPHNFVNLGLISLLFPQARIIHCQRDPRDTCLSIYFQHFGWLHPYATNLAHLGSYYRLYQMLVRHWESVIDLPMLTVHYEDLVTDQERVSRKLVDFIGLDWDDNCLQFHTTKRTVATASYDQVRKPMYTQSIARWKHYEKHIGPLVEALGNVLAE